MWQKREMDKLDYIQIKQPLGYKQYCQESEKQPIEWEKISVVAYLIRACISTSKELSLPNNKNINKPSS